MMFQYNNIILLGMGIFFMFIFLILVGLSYQYCATKIDDYNYPAPGKLIDIGGYKIHSYCVGNGKPTVILDAGLGGNLTWWSLVQAEVSKFTQVCSYDRAGYGWSDAGPKPRTSEIIVKELHVLLKNQDIQPPYILVGHSFGGTNMKLYANTYSDDVFAVILVDSAHEKQYERFEEYEKESQTLKTTLLARIKNYILDSKFSHYVGITRLLLPNSMKPYFADSLPKDFQKIIIAKASSVKSLEARDSEWENIKESFKQSEKATNNLINKPLIVISRGKKEDEITDKIWLKCQQELAEESVKCKHIFANNSGHMIHVEQPEIIIDAIHELIKEYEKS